MNRNSSRRILAAALAAACASLLLAAAPPEQRAQGGGTRAEPAIPEPIREAVEAVSKPDSARLASDKPYATEMLKHVDSLLPLTAPRSPAIWVLRNLRLMALHTLDRTDEAKGMAAGIVAVKPRLAISYFGPLVLAARTRDTRAILRIIETASTSLKDPEEVSGFHRLFPEEAARDLWSELLTAKDAEGRYRLGEALVTLGWPGDESVRTRDFYRVVAIRGRLERGGHAAAAALARQVATPEPLLELFALRRYDALFETPVDHAARLAEALRFEDAHTSSALKSRPGDLKVLQLRASHLRTAGREADAVALLWPIVSDMNKVEQGGEPAFWLVNEAAYGLIATGRASEALQLMNKLIALDMDKHRYLINMAINHASAMLPDMARHAEAVDLGMKLDRQADKYASAYGRMWIWSGLACNLAAQGKKREAAPWLEKLKAGSADNKAAHMHGLLCLNRPEEAERLLLARLGEADPTTVVMAMQDFTATPPASEHGRMLGARWTALIARPAVVQALSNVGRRLSVPLSRAYWGAY